MATHAEAWEGYARENAEFYILTHDVDFATADGQDYFFRTGRDDAEAILREAAPFRGARAEVALEIGCGIGRLSLPMARHFGTVRVVDVAPTMLRRVAENAAAAGLGNVRPFLPDAGWDEGPPVDFVYTRWVLQHIADFGVIADYVRRIARALHADGTAHLQFDTRPRTAAYRVRNALPDFVLPRTWRRGVRRIRRNPADLRALFAANGLRVAHELRPDTEEHVFILRK